MSRSTSASFRKTGGPGRATLTLLGLLLTLAGGAALTRSLRVWDDIAGAGSQDRSGLPVLTQDVSDVVNRNGSWVWPLAALLGLLLALLGYRLLRAQLRTRPARTRQVDLTDDPSEGITRVPTSVVTEALVADLASVPGVEDAGAAMRGDPARPLVDVTLDIADDADVSEVLDRVEQGPLATLRSAFDLEPAHTAVEVRIVEPSSRHLA